MWKLKHFLLLTKCGKFFPKYQNCRTRSCRIYFDLVSSYPLCSFLKLFYPLPKEFLSRLPLNQLVPLKSYGTILIISLFHPTGPQQFSQCSKTRLESAPSEVQTHRAQDFPKLSGQSLQQMQKDSTSAEFRKNYNKKKSGRKEEALLEMSEILR